MKGDKRSSFRHQNLQALAIEMFKVHTKTSPEISLKNKGIIICEIKQIL